VQIIDGEYPGAHFRISMPVRADDDRPVNRTTKAQAHAA
jgi:hypothetical protein